MTCSLYIILLIMWLLTKFYTNIRTASIATVCYTVIPDLFSVGIDQSELSIYYTQDIPYIKLDNKREYVLYKTALDPLLDPY